MDNKMAAIVVAALGAAILLASLTADMTGVGDQVAFGPKQTMGTVAGIILVGIGAYLYKKSGTRSHSGE